MQQFLIEGGTPLSGVVKPGGNKNAILKMIPACLLTEEAVTLTNVPDILDVSVTIDIMRDLGAEIEWVAPETLRIVTKNVTKTALDPHLAIKTRASFVFAGPMLARFGHVELPSPGGDVIGERRLDTHIKALEQLGVAASYEPGKFTLTASKLIGANILLQEASVMATENCILAAALATGTTVIRNAASEPHVQDLCNMLVAMGAKIDGIGSNRIVIEGADTLHGAEARCGADFMEVGSYIAAAVVTGGEIRILDADPQHMDMVEIVFDRLGVTWQTENKDIVVPADQVLTIRFDIGGRLPVIKAQPWPGFPPDLMSIALLVASQSAGAVIFHDWMYESRFFFTDKLVRMGARVTLCDPHRVLVQGPTALKSSPYISSPDIRAGMALVLAALAAKGQTRISNIRQIDRGYERVEEKLVALGAKIERISLDALETAEINQLQIQTEG